MAIILIPVNLLRRLSILFEKPIQGARLAQSDRASDSYHMSQSEGCEFDPRGGLMFCLACTCTSRAFFAAAALLPMQVHMHMSRTARSLIEEGPVALNMSWISK